MNQASLQVNVCSLSSQVSKRGNPFFKLVAQDLTTGSMYTFVLMKDSQTTQVCLDHMFKCNVSQDKLFKALSQPARFLRNPYDLQLVLDDDKIPPVFSLVDILEVELPAVPLNRQR